MRPTAKPLALEPRLVFDADTPHPLDPLAGAHDHNGVHPDAAAAKPVVADDRSVDHTVTSDKPVAPVAAAELTPIAKEVVFVDTSVADWQTLVSQVKPGAEVYLIDPNRDGLTQIETALRDQTGITAVHIVSHGAEGELFLGSSHYTAENLAAAQTSLAAIGRSLTANADVLLYGCDIGRSAEGVALIGRLASATGADVAASTDVTGTARVGGNWTLERTTGSIESSLFLREAGVAQYDNWLSTVALDGKTGWTPVMFGASQDPVGDSQAGAADTDIVGDANHGSLYVAFDSGGTSSTADDTVAFRLRIDNPTSSTVFNGVAVVGIDANSDGRVDVFMCVDGRNNTQAVRLLDPGTAANISPNTTSTSPLPTGWLANNGIYPFSTSNYSVTAVSASTDPNWNGVTDIGGDGKTDVFVSWRVPVADLATVLAKPSAVDRNGVYGPRGAAGLPGFTKDSVVRYVSFTQTQPGPINGDLNGVGATYDKNATFSSLGAYTAAMSASTPIAAGPRLSITPPGGDGVLNASEDDSVSISGTSQYLANKTLTLTISDGVATVTRTTTTGSDGAWTVSGMDLSALNDGTLTITATVDPDADGATSNNVVDSTTLLHDKTPPALAIDQLATTTSGTPTFTGTSDLPDGSVLSIAIDTDNNPATSNLLYQVVVSGGLWSLNTAAVAAVSGTLPTSALSAYAKVTVTASDAAGNSTSVVALNRPTVNTVSTNSTAPTLSGAWTNVAGDVLTITVNGATYTLTPSGNTWSLNLATATPSSGTLAAFVAGQSYEVTATVTRNGVNVSDTSHTELAIINSPIVLVGISSGTSSTDTTPVITGTSQNAGGYVIVRLDPNNDGNLTDAVAYSVVTDGSGNWSLDTGSATPISGSVPSTGFIGATGVRVTDSTGAVAATQTLTISTPTIGIGSITSTATTNSAAQVNNTGAAANWLNMTEDDAVTISGTATNGFTVDVVVSDASGNRVTASNVAVAGGAWSATGLNLSALDNSTLTVTAKLSGTSISATNTSVVHDKTAPRIFITNQSTIPKSQAQISGASELPNTALTITIRDSGDTTTVWTGSATTDANGNWSVTTPSGTNLVSGSSGNIIIRVAPTGTATDTAGNIAQQAERTPQAVAQGAANSTRTIAINTVAGDNVITADEISGGITITGTTSLTTAATSAFTVTVTDGTVTQTATVTANTSGNWTATLTKAQVQALKNGPLTVTASVSDTSVTPNISVYDIELPTLSLDTPALTITDDTAGIASGPVTFTFTFSEAVTSFDATDITVTNGTKGAFSGSGTTYTLVVTPNSNSSGSIGVSVSAAAANGSTTGRASGAGSASQSFNTTAAAAAPSVTIDTTALATDATPVISGTTSLSAGAPIVIAIDTNNDGATDLTYSATVQSGGTWSVDLDTATPTSGTLPADGVPAGSKITATATNAYGISSSAVGLNKPTVVPQNTNDNTPTITGTWTQVAGDTLSVVVNGVTYSVANGNLAVSATGWTLTPTVALADASYNVTATVSRTSGGSAVDPTSSELLVDTSASVTIAGGATVAITGDSTPVISGNTTGLPAGTILTLSLDTDNNGSADLEYKTAIANDGTWSVDTATAVPASGTFPSGKLNGVIPLTATATDPAGNVGTDTQTLTVDVTPPAIAITSNSKTPDTTPVLSGTTDLPSGSTITIVVDPDNTAGGPSYTYTTTVQPDGTWTIDTGTQAADDGTTTAVRSFQNGDTLGVTASGTDAVGNSASVTKAITIGPAPTIAVTRPTLGGDFIANATEDDAVAISGTTTGTLSGETVTISITDGTHTITDTTTVQNDLSWSIPALDISGMNDGTVTVFVSYTDASGNTYTDATTFAHDKTPPVAVLSASTASITGATTVTITFAEPVSGLQLSDFATSNDAAISNLSGSGAVYTVTLTPSVNGTASVWLPSSAVTDAAGNPSSASNILSFSVTGQALNDTVVPTVTSIVRQTPTTAVTNADSVTFRVTFSEAVQNVDTADFALSGTAAASGTITGVVAINATTYDVTVAGVALASANGTLSLGFAGGQNIRDTASSPNALSNTTPTGANQSFTLDNTGPQLTGTSPADNATGVAVDAGLTLTFDTTLVAGTGSVMLKRSSDGSTVETFDIATGVGDAGGTLGLSGATIFLNPGSDLASGIGYYVQVAATAVKDAAGNAFAGVADATTFNFTTAGVADVTPPVITGPSGTPGDASAAISINENTTAVADLTADETVTWAIVGGEDQAKFTIDPSTGALAFSSAPNFEAPTDGGTSGSNTYLVQVRATDGAGNSSTQTITVAVNDVDEAAPVIAGGQSFSYAENQTANAVIGTVAASDDVGVTGFRFAATGTGTSADGYFTIGNDGTIRITNAGIAAGVAQNDFETLPNGFIYGVEAGDASGRWSSAVNVTLGVTNLNDNTPTLGNYTVSLNEGSVNGTAVQTVAGSDADGDTLSYSITAGNGSGAFTIDAATGAITVADGSKLDFETSPTFTLTVQASDGTRSTTGTVTVNLVDIDESAPVVAGGQSFSYAENQTANAVIGTVAASDDIGVTGFRFAATGTGTSADGYFTIGNDGTIRITNAGIAAGVAQNDFETLPNSFVYGIEAGDGSGRWSSAVNVTLGVTNLNDNTPALGNYSVSLNEGSVNGTAVQTVAGSDADGDTLSYSITAGNSSGAFAIDAATGAITVADASKLDFETSPTFTLTVQASDGTRSTTGTVTVNLVDVDEAAPVIAGGQSFSYAENQTANAVIGTVAATDDVSVTGFRFAATGNGTSADGYFTIGNDGTIRITNAGIAAGVAQNDFETLPNGFVYGVEAGDGSGRWSSAVNVTLGVTNLNDNTPALGNYNVSLNERSVNGTAVQTVAGTDADGDTLSYSITAGNGSGVFAIDAATGAITVADASKLDFETTPTFTLTVQASDGSRSTTGTVTVNLVDVDEGAPVIAGGQSFSYAENQTANAVIGTVAASDDVSVTGFRFAASGTGTSADGYFTIGNDGTIRITNAGIAAGIAQNDFETLPNSFVYGIEAGDGSGRWSSAVNVTLGVTNLNDNTPTLGNYTVSLNEGSVNGTAVQTVAGSDADGDTLSYSITAGNGSGAFTIDAATGAITVADASKLDFETTPSFTLTVQASDGTRSTTGTVTVNLIDVDEGAPVIANGQSFSYAENQTANAVIGTVAASDDVSVTGFRFAATGTGTSADGYFTIGNDGTIRITNAGIAAGVAQNDFETLPNSFVYGIEAGDAAGRWSSVVNVTLGVTNLNDNTPTLGNYTVSLNEGSVNGTAVQTVAGSDTDGDTLSYSITAGNGSGVFAIDAATGAITVADASKLDFETTPTFTLTVQASDGTRTTTGTVTVNLTDVDETVPDTTAPVITGPSGAAGDATSTKSIAENTSTVTTFTANEPVTWSLAGGEDAHVFSIDPVTGVLRFNAAPDYENPSDGPLAGTNAYVIQVRAVDGAGNAATQTVTVHVTDVDESVPDQTPPVITGPSGQPGDAAANAATPENATNVGTFAANETVTWAIAGGADAARFTIDPATGALSFRAAPDFERPTDSDANNTYAVQVQATDAAGNSSFQTLNVTVANVNEAPIASSVDTVAGIIGSPIPVISVPAFSDVDGDALTYRATLGNGAELPSWLVFDAATRSFHGTPPAGTGTGDLSIRITGSDGALTASTTFVLSLTRPNSPRAADDTATAREAGGVRNATAGANAEGNVLANDAGSALAITAVQAGTSLGAQATPLTSVGVDLVGQHGTLHLNGDGSYTYAANQADPTVEALNTGRTAQDVFTYQVRDQAGQISTATLKIVIDGADDTAIATPIGDHAATLGSPLTPFTVPEFTDVDDGALTYAASLADGSALPAWLVFDPATRTFSGTPPFGATAGNLSIRITGTAGTHSADATFTLTLALPAAPLGADDGGNATEAGGVANSMEGEDARGSVLTNDVGSNSLAVTKIHPGAGTSGAVDIAAGSTSAQGGTVVQGLYGSLTISADGSYVYHVDNANAAVEALNDGATLADVFTYELVDQAGQRTSARLTITVHGATDAPVPVPVDQTPTPVPPTPPDPTPAPAPTPIPNGDVQPRSDGNAGAGSIATDSSEHSGADGIGGRLGDLSTSGSGEHHPAVQGFRLTVIPADTANLTLYRGVPDQFCETHAEINFTIPPDAFAHTRDDAQVVLHATLTDGRPLPNWLQFDRVTGTFHGIPPEDFTGELKIKVIARDTQGQQAEAIFRFQVGKLSRGTGAKLGLSQQLKGFAHLRTSRPAQAFWR